MRRLFSATALLAGVVASIATSTTNPPTSSVQLPGPGADLDARGIQRTVVDVFATQSPSGPFAGAVMVSADATSVFGEATVTASLHVVDAFGSTEIARDTAVASPGTDGDLFLFDDLDAFAGCADGSTCEQAFEVVFETTGEVAIDWALTAELYDLDDIGRTSTLEVSTR